MGDAYGWTYSGGRQVFDAKLLEQAAAELQLHNKTPQLKDMLLQGLVPRGSLGGIGGADGALTRLGEAYDSLTAELGKVGIDLADLAFRTLAAAQAASDVDLATRAAARRGHQYE